MLNEDFQMNIKWKGSTLSNKKDKRLLNKYMKFTYVKKSNIKTQNEFSKCKMSKCKM